ncbi:MULTISPECIES: cation:proton antiporter [Nonlabens]|uniref:Cell shape-determining protein n=7 Tax=Nonlabens ulvanivorans TaxID=906888 RepID=A0A084JU42_NONUL|nr:cation:proton antiporter [Nonlabens ulvanivorans]KEZ92476.1 cell shape-determining protein [Nonlabens ulvanivorans]PRX15313.1 sodium/proton antiporter (CPA1 family) [Nonlabens ulvanivorans]
MLELAGIIILGILAQWMAWRFKIPAILPLIIIGLLVGPIASLYTEDASKLIEPIWNGQQGLFPGESLFYFVSLAISIILFEGGLTLKKEEILNTGPVIGKLISVAVIITFAGAGVAAHYIFGLSWEIALLFSALIIVTGPTVITPILRNIPLKKDVSSILKWEGILIDPIGALFAVLVFEFISANAGGEFTLVALEEFGKIVLFGFSFGFSFAHALAFSIKKKLIPHYLLNVFTLAAVLGVFVLSDSFAHESGLLAVVVMGMVMGNINLPNLKELLYFKESLSVLLISILFILLAANINMEDLYLIYRWETAVLFAIVSFIIRPLGVFASSINSGLKINEKLFISWVGPRGIVAAGIASLFGSKLVTQGVEGAEYITPLVFMIVLGTVLLNATTARLFAKIVGVFLKQSDGIMIVGASKFSRLIASYLKVHGRSVVLVDTNTNNVRIAKEKGLDAVAADIYSDAITDDIEFNNIGFLMALTGNSQINDYALERFTARFGENGAYRLVHSTEVSNPDENPTRGLFSSTDDYVNMMEVARYYGEIHEITIKSQEHYEGLIEITKTDENIIPLFIRKKNEIDIIPSTSLDMEVEEDSKLVYLGKKIVVQASGDVVME